MDTSKMLALVAFVANLVAETVEYKSWSDEFCRKETTEAYRQMQVAVVKENIDWTSLTIDELRALRFVPWSEPDENGYVNMLVPLYLLRVLPYGLRLFCIDGTQAHVGKDEIDNDVRQGCIAYGIKVKA